MIKLKSILSEMRIVSTPKNYLPKLEEIEDKVKNNFTPIEEKQRLLIEAAKLVLPIWEVYYKDDRLRLTIQAAEEYLNNPTKENRKKVKEAAFVAYDTAVDVVVDAASAVAYSVAFAASYAVTNAIYCVDIVNAIYYAIKATKLFFKIE